MPLESVGAMMSRARAGGYAVGYFESWNLESLQGVIDAAERARSPVILGFNGEFLSREGRRAEERLAWYASLGRAAAESAAVPCALLFNECPRLDWVRSAVGAGFNFVMPISDAPPADATRQIAKIVREAHARGVAVEGEIGTLPCGAEGDVKPGGEPTEPGDAADFVESTGVDLLAVSVGNVHIRVRGQGGLDLDRLEAIRERVDVPLVLHGGTGIEPSSLRAAIACGVTKVNYGTVLKQHYLRAVRAALGRELTDPHRLLGLGGDDDVMVAGRLAVREAVLGLIGDLGSEGRG